MRKIAVIGCGRIAKFAHFPAFEQMDNVKVKYACDLIIEKAQAMKDEYPNKIEQVISDYKIALNDEEVDAVYITTPNYAHYTITMDALKAGKHVFCEKPITVSYDLSVKMAEEAERQGKMLNIGVCNRYHKSVEMLREYYQQGKFGNIYHIYCSFRAFRNIPGLGGAFTDKKQSGGGVLIDWGVHFFDLVLYILGGAKVKNLTCDTYSEMAKDMKSYKYHNMWAEDTADIENGVNDVDDYITGYVRTDKASISFNGAWAQNIDKTEMYIDILGDKGGARLDYGGLFTFTDGSTLETERLEYQIPDMYLKENQAFIESIESGVKNKGNVIEVLETAKLLDALYESAKIKKEITL